MAKVDITQLDAFDQLDDASAALIIQLQGEDVEELRSSRKGKGPESDISDAECAVRAYQEELQQMNYVLSDRCMSRSLARAIVADSALLTETVAQEDAVANDRAVAERLNQGDETVGRDHEAMYNSSLDDLFIARLTALYVSGTHNDESPLTVDDEQEATTGESSGWAASRKSKPTAVHLECVICNERKRDFEMFRAPCGHHYCQQCLIDLFEHSTTDETLFPPRCCRQEISLPSARLYLDTDLVKRFQNKSLEFGTADRTYCSRPTCSSFITSANITGETAMCPVCRTMTCTICKGNTHDGECPQDIATQQILEAGRQQGWQRCYGCRRMVELDTGCNHIICFCRAEFCYVCGLRWKTCNCAQWDEDRLVVRAQQFVDREQPEHRVPAAQQAARIQEAVDHLRERHNCQHEAWRWTVPNEGLQPMQEEQAVKVRI